MKNKVIRLIRNWPVLDAHLAVGPIRFRTEILNERYESGTYTWVSVYWQVLKWSGNFRIYRPQIYGTK